MPELPEAETIARKLHAQLAGARLARVVHLRRDMLRNGCRRTPPWLSDVKVERVGRRGKRPIVYLEGERGIVFFLGMTGYLGIHPSAEPSGKHTHLRIRLAESDNELRFQDFRRFGGLSFFELRNGDEPPGVADLGIEPLEMTIREFRSIASRRRQIKALLMDQCAVAGLGNIYCDEALHRAGIHPLELAADIDHERIARLCHAIKNILRAAIRAEGTTINNYQHPDGPGAFQRRLHVYGHENEPCQTCQATIIRIVAAGRSTHLCPQCQRLSL